MLTWSRISRVLQGAAVIALLFLALTPVRIQDRLHRNGAIAKELVAALQAQFPRFEFRGGPSYEREVIYISATGDLDESARRGIELWLRKHKADQDIRPALLLRFSDEEEVPI